MPEVNSTVVNGEEEFHSTPPQDLPAWVRVDFAFLSHPLVQIASEIFSWFFSISPRNLKQLIVDPKLLLFTKKQCLVSNYN